jgi:hypothetical protein
VLRTQRRCPCLAKQGAVSRKYLSLAPDLATCRSVKVRVLLVPKREIQLVHRSLTDNAPTDEAQEI